MIRTRVYDLNTGFDAGIDDAARVIASGGLVAMPTETVYGLGANALDGDAVRRIFEVKGRPSDNPLIVHISEISQAERYALVTPLAEKLMRKFWPGPFTAVLKKKDVIPAVVSGGLDTVGLRLPDSRAARELISRSGCPIAAPSANLSGKPSPTTAEHCVRDLGGKIPVILDAGPCRVGVESTVVLLTGEVPVILRPGGITAEMILEEAGCVSISPAVMGGLKEGEKAASPGMKYKHYSPRARVSVVRSASADSLARHLMMLYDNDVSNGLNPIIMCMTETAELLGGRNVRVLGRNAEEVARNLFSELRGADDAGFDRIYFEGCQETGMGLAVMNRAIRAAGFDITDIDG